MHFIHRYVNQSPDVVTSKIEVNHNEHQETEVYQAEIKQNSANLGLISGFIGFIR